MGVLLVLYFVTFSIVLVHAYNLNLTSCRRCSNRVDVPCHLQELYHCLHDEFDGIWPGVPRNLSSRRVKIGKDLSAANFTWNAPYDASYRTLNGFLLTVNIAEDYFIHRMLYTLPQQPRCFFANLSGTNWDTVPNPHSVLFHFDCVTSKDDSMVEVSLTLKSSPVPGEKSLTPLSKSLKLAPASIPMEQTEVLMTINFTVEGTTVKIKFGPVQLNFTYRVCLSKVLKEYECYKDIFTEEGQGEVDFTDVDPDTYKIYVQKQPNPDNPMFVTKPFNVTEVKQKEQLPVVAIVTMTCLLFVAGITTLCFCSMRDRCRCLRSKICNCAYQRALHSAPNNMSGDNENDSILEILPLYYDESDSFTSAVQKICCYLSSWSNCHINYTWTNKFSHNPELSFKDSHPNCILLIFLSSRMVSTLNRYQHQDDPRTKIFNKILIESDSKAFRRMVISFHPLPGVGEYLHCSKIYKIRKPIIGNNDNKVDINTEILYQMLKEINGDDDEIKPGWSGYEEICCLSTAIKYIPEKDLEYWEHSISNVVCNIQQQKNRQKQLETYKWAELQQNRFCPPCSQNGYIAATVCEDRGHYEGDIDIESASVCQDGYYPMIRELDHVIDKNNDYWSPPEEDSESVTQSVIDQKQMEIYQNYKANMSDTRL